MFYRRFIIVCTLIASVFFIGNSQDTTIYIKHDTIPVLKNRISQEEREFQKKYEENIIKERINGVYIPIDLEDAFNEIIELSPAHSIEKFKTTDEKYAVPRVYGGLGRWIIVNWNLYEGSRIGHKVKSYGVNHPDDQAYLILATLHRHLNQQELKAKELALELEEKRIQYNAERKKEIQE